MYKGKTILITGGTGSWGRELTRQLLERNPGKIIIYSRGEIAQVDMERSFCDSRLQFVIGDIRDREAVMRVTAGVDIIFQLAALKHVPICENQPGEAIQSNVIGMTNMIDAAIINRVQKFIDVSTDKAVDPINVYGMTKAIGERLTIQANTRTRHTDFVCIRGGNALGSNGSLVPYVIKQIRENNVVKLTDPKMTRFFLTLSQAVRLLLFAAENGLGGETYVMNMPSFKIVDLIKLLIAKHGNKKTRLVITGPREGEKIHEVLVSPHEVGRCFKVNADYYVILSQLPIGRNGRSYNERIDGPLSSDGNLRSNEILKAMI